MFLFLLGTILLALIFDFINGFHDAANAIATVVATRVLSPFHAVLWAAAFNFLAFWIFDLKVANTVAKTVLEDFITIEVVFAGVLAGIIWNLLTWRFGIPSSSSHTLIGGFAGAAIAHSGSFNVVDQLIIFKTVAFIFLAPVIGLLMGYFISVLIIHLSKRYAPEKLHKVYRRIQLLSSAAFSLGHGGSDSQKVIGILAAALLAYKQIVVSVDDIPSWLQIGNVDGKIDLPIWIPLACYSVISLGTMMGGWRIISTMGGKITKVSPFEGVAAESAGAITLYAISQGLGIPVSTTHTVTGSIIGTGMVRRVSSVRWGITVHIFWAWVLTIPVSALLASLLLYLTELFI